MALSSFHATGRCSVWFGSASLQANPKDNRHKIRVSFLSMSGSGRCATEAVEYRNHHLLRIVSSGSTT